MALLKHSAKEMKRILNNKGESIAEALVSVLIISLVFVFVANAVMTSAEINSKIETKDNVFKNGTDASGSVTVTITSSDSFSDTPAVQLKQSQEGKFYYYDPN